MDAWWNKVKSLGEGRYPGQRSYWEGQWEDIPSWKLWHNNEIDDCCALSLLWAVRCMEMSKLGALGVERNKIVSTLSWCTINGPGWQWDWLTHKKKERMPILLPFCFSPFLGMGVSSQFWWLLSLFQFQTPWTKKILIRDSGNSKSLKNSYLPL